MCDVVETELLWSNANTRRSAPSHVLLRSQVRQARRAAEEAAAAAAERERRADEQQRDLARVETEAAEAHAAALRHSLHHVMSDISGVRCGGNCWQECTLGRSAQP